MNPNFHNAAENYYHVSSYPCYVHYGVQRSLEWSGLNVFHIGLYIWIAGVSNIILYVIKTLLLCYFQCYWYNISWEKCLSSENLSSCQCARQLCLVRPFIFHSRLKDKLFIYLSEMFSSCGKFPVVAICFHFHSSHFSKTCSVFCTQFIEHNYSLIDVTPIILAKCHGA